MSDSELLLIGIGAIVLSSSLLYWKLSKSDFLKNMYPLDPAVEKYFRRVIAHNEATSERMIADDKELMSFVEFICNADIRAVSDPHAGANNGKELIRVKSAGRKIRRYLEERLVA